MEIGAIINDQYTVVEHIGRGGMADVWSARDQRLRRMVAIKTIAVGLTQDVDPVALFRTEAQTIAQMEHPHILPIYDFGEFGGSLYIVMRFVTGGSLEDLLEQNPLSLVECLRIAEAIAQALDYAHANKIIHLDLKPPNILMDSSGAPYLADFGLATVLDPEGRARNPGSGTLLYMAPEQLTAEVLDHRADIYSFSIMIYHMLTAKLPFDGTMPLALRQLQFNDVMPALEDTNPNFPAALTQVLRKGTAKDPANRPAKLMDIIQEMRAIIQPQTSGLPMFGEMTDTSELMLVDAVNLQTERLVSLGDPDLLEAVDIYTRARYNWAGGQGRFLMGLTHFLIMSNYYQDAERYNLTVDEAGYQMILRGALEFDHDIPLWWSRLSDDSRRWVCLHTVRSGTTPARIRALYRLETLPDDQASPVIPKLVAQALEIEKDTDARLAALMVLGSRSKLMKATSTYQIKTEFRGRLLTTMTRLGIEVAPPSVWREAVYSPEIDIMVAEQSLDVDEPRVAQFAARTVGKMRTLTGVRYLANEQRNKRDGALQALALVRDETPSLPDIVSPQARAYAWLTNTVRRLLDNPLDMVLRFFLAWMGGAIAMGQHVYIAYRSESLFTARRWGNTVAMGVVVGLFIAITVMFADEFSARLRGFWSWWLRLALSLVLSVVMGVLVWSAFTWFYLDGPPVWDLMRMGGTGMAVGYVLVAMLNLRGWKALALPSLLTFLPIFIENMNVCLQTYSCYTAIPFQDTPILPAFNFFPVAGIGFVLGTLIGLAIPHKDPEAETILSVPNTTKILLSGGVALLWVVAVVLAEIQIYQMNFITWDSITALFALSMLVGIAGMFFLRQSRRVAFFAVAMVAFVALTAIATHSVFAMIGAIGTEYYDPMVFVAPEEGANAIVGLLQYDLYHQIFTVGIPVVLTMALGAYLRVNITSIAQWIGKPQKHHEGRDAWFTGVLIYALIMSGVISVFALFSMHKNIPYALGWSLLGFLTFVASLATWRWAKWGAQALIALAVLMILGGVVFDVYFVAQYLDKGIFPPLFETQALLEWGIWAVLMGVSAWGALRRQLWGGIGLAVLVMAWYPITILGFIPASGTIQAVANLALLAYAISPFMAEMEHGRFVLWQRQAIAKTKPQELTVSAPPATIKLPLQTLPVVMPLPKNVLKTEIDVIPPRRAMEMATEPDVDNAPVYGMRTELDMNPPLAPRPMTTSDGASVVPPVEPKINFGSLSTKPEKPELKTEMDASSQLSEASSPKPRIKFDTSALKPKPEKPELKTEMDASSQLSEDSSPKPRIKFDTSALKPKPEKPELKTEMDASSQLSDDSSPKPRIKFDMSALKSKPEKPELKTEMDASSQLSDDSSPKPRIKMDTSALKPSKPMDEDERPTLKTPLRITTDLPDTPPVISEGVPPSEAKPSSKPQIKVDLNALKPKSGEDKKEATQPKRTGLRFDTNLLKKSSPNVVEPLREDPDESSDNPPTDES